MEYKKFTTEELKKRLSATCEILEIFNTQGPTSELMINADEYGYVVKIQLCAFAEISRRESEGAERNAKQIKNQ